MKPRGQLWKGFQSGAKPRGDPALRIFYPTAQATLPRPGPGDYSRGAVGLSGDAQACTPTALSFRL